MDKTDILIVEDEAIVAADIAATLRKLGYEVPGICTSGKEVIDLLSYKKVDLILMDIHIKGDIDGIELAARIRTEMRLPVIFLTAYSDDETLERAKIAQPFGYLSKSLYYKDIKSAIETAIYRNKMKLQVEEKEELLSLTLKSIEEAVITAEKDGRILFYNRRAEELFSLPEPDTVNEGEPVIPDSVEFQTETGALLKDILKLSDIPARINLVKPLMKKTIPLDCSVSRNLRTEKGEVQNVYVFRDITNRQKIREVEELLSTVVENSEDVIAALSLSGKVKSWNRGAEKILKISSRRAVGRNISDLLPQAPFPDLRKRNSGLQTMEFIHHGDFNETGDIEGSRFISAHLTPLRTESGKITGYSFVGRDLTARTELERKISEAEEDVRVKIGRDLHDNLGQQLTGISLKLQALRNGIKRENYGNVENISVELGELIKDAIRETRELSRGLVPGILRNEGLSHALRNLASYLERIYGIKTECNLDETIAIDKSVEPQLFHIAQESVNNAVKHGKAGKIVLNLRRETEEAVLEIIDDGSGFNEDRVKRGLGLDNMRYRADIIRGSLDVRSVPERGTVVSCRLIMQIDRGGAEE